MIDWMKSNRWRFVRVGMFAVGLVVSMLTDQTTGYLLGAMTVIVAIEVTR